MRANTNPNICLACAQLLEDESPVANARGSELEAQPHEIPQNRRAFRVELTGAETLIEKAGSR